jgi:hypothetical protein
VKVPRGLADELLDLAAVAVPRDVPRIVLLPQLLGEGAMVPASDRVEVVVFVDVLDWVEVLVGSTPSSLQGDAATSRIDASNRSQRILLQS